MELHWNWTCNYKFDGNCNRNCSWNWNWTYNCNWNCNYSWNWNRNGNCNWDEIVIIILFWIKNGKYSELSIISNRNGNFIHLDVLMHPNHRSRGLKSKFQSGLIQIYWKLKFSLEGRYRKRNKIYPAVYQNSIWKFTPDEEIINMF